MMQNDDAKRNDKRKKEEVNEFPDGMARYGTVCCCKSGKVNGRQENENDGKTWMKIPLKYGN